MSVLKIFKISFLYIGTVIGAGFATGKELTSYFKDTSFITIILGGICLGLFCGYYLYLGKSFSEQLSVIAFNKYHKVFDFLLFISTFFVLVAMFDTSDIILKNFNISFGGYFTILFTLLSAVIGISFIKKINFLVIPAIVVMVMVIYFKNPVILGGKVNLSSPILYAGMNIMLAGFVIKDEGKDLTNRQILLTTIITSVILSIIMLFIYEIVRGSTAVMPLIDIAEKYNLTKVASVIIYLAILTTALSSAIVCINYLNGFIKNSFITCLILFTVAIPLKIYVGFSNIVKYVYPVVSIIGVVITFLTFVQLMKKQCNSQKS